MTPKSRLRKKARRIKLRYGIASWLESLEFGAPFDLAWYVKHQGGKWRSKWPAKKFRMHNFNKPMRETAELGAVGILPADESGHPRQAELQGIAECICCGQPVELWAETDQWTEDDSGKMVHDGYGPAIGHCCGMMYADGFEGCQVFDLKQRRRPKRRRS